MLTGLTPTLFYCDPIAALRFLEKAFGFETTMLVTDDQGRVGHSEVKVGPTSISVGGEFAAADLLGPAAMKSRDARKSALGDQRARIDPFSGQSVESRMEASASRARRATYR